MTCWEKKTWPRCWFPVFRIRFGNWFPSSFHSPLDAPSSSCKPLLLFAWDLPLNENEGEENFLDVFKWKQQPHLSRLKAEDNTGENKEGKDMIPEEDTKASSGVSLFILIPVLFLRMLMVLSSPADSPVLLSLNDSSLGERERETV